MIGQESAEALALQALTWVLQDDEIMPRFLAATGAAPADLGQMAQDPLFLGAVLDFLLTEDSLVLAFAEAGRLRPDLVLQARAALPGGLDPHWT